MRSLLVLMLALVIVSPSAFAQKGQGKKLAKMCREENPNASKAELKKCVKAKAKAAKAG
ncbi:hypothetical protein BDW_12550 [Bdellovibrio bacteriovorus W]|nr:hypothetical protein BDW_12550 [Bdellovibrio bacteriovorus W]